MTPPSPAALAIREAHTRYRDAIGTPHAHASYLHLRAVVARYSQPNTHNATKDQL